MVAAVVALAAAIRLAYVATDGRAWVGGDGLSYHFEALRLADGLGYTSGWGDVGAPIAHHPPAWLTLLGLVSWLGGRSVLAHQLVGVAVGLGVVVLTGLVGRRYFGSRVGVLAAAIAALYPGFWVIEAQVLSEPLGLLLLGVFCLVVANLHGGPTLRRSVAVGAVCGLLALVRSEQLVLLPLVVAPLLLCARELPLRQRAAWLAAAACACVTIISPWAVYNSSRFATPVILSTNGGETLLAGNCPPATYGGERLGYFDSTCGFHVGNKPPGLDRSQRAGLAFHAALRNFGGHLDRMPVVIPARIGRMLAIFRPSQTVAFTAHWMATGHWPVWAWVVAYWLLVPLAIAGAWTVRRDRWVLLPLLGPLLVATAIVAVAYGEPRYHTISDLGVVVLAAVGVEGIVRRLTRARAAAVPVPAP